MIGHLGDQVSALLDGHLDGAVAERAWAHVHTCAGCRDHVERAAWVKRRVARLAVGPEATAPERLKGALLGALPHELGAAPYDGLSATLGSPPGEGRARRGLSLSALGGGAAGAAVLGVIALGAGAGPASAPTLDRRGPVQTQPSPAGGVAGFAPIGVRTRSRGR